MKLYNTMSRKIEVFTPQHDKNVSLYACGLTVYDSPHIGNWMTFLRYDLLVRTLKASGYQVEHVENITDVGHLTGDVDEGEDKLEKGAKREGQTAWEVAQKYTEEFLKGRKSLNMLEPEVMPKATEHIAEQIALVETLEAKGFTYRIDDGIYFDTAKLDDYGKLARLDLERLQAGARVEMNPQKRNHTDFALWKFTPPGQKRDMEWNSPWGRGFPGWHVECSAMSMKYLGETLDIHAGGIDHIAVHHTNEIAQSESATGKEFARYWLHANHMMVNGQKISKSLQNGITLAQIIERGFAALDVRMVALQAHYRTQSDFVWEALAAARTRRLSLQALADLRFQAKATAENSDFTPIWDEVLTAMQDDLASPKALACLSKFEAELEQQLISPASTASFVDFLTKLDLLFGLNLLGSQDITPAQKQLIVERETARNAKDFARADKLRQELLDQKIALRDTSHGSIWYRL